VQYPNGDYGIHKEYDNWVGNTPVRVCLEAPNYAGLKKLFFECLAAYEKPIIKFNTEINYAKHTVDSIYFLIGLEWYDGEGYDVYEYHIRESTPNISGKVELSAAPVMLVFDNSIEGSLAKLFSRLVTAFDKPAVVINKDSKSVKPDNFLVDEWLED